MLHGMHFRMRYGRHYALWNALWQHYVMHYVMHYGMHYGMHYVQHYVQHYALWNALRQPTMSAYRHVRAGGLLDHHPAEGGDRLAHRLQRVGGRAGCGFSHLFKS